MCIDIADLDFLFFFGGDVYEVTWGKHIAYVGIRWYELEVVGLEPFGKVFSPVFFVLFLKLDDEVERHSGVSSIAFCVGVDDKEEVGAFGSFDKFGFLLSFVADTIFVGLFVDAYFLDGQVGMAVVESLDIAIHAFESICREGFVRVVALV